MEPGSTAYRLAVLSQEGAKRQCYRNNKRRIWQDPPVNRTALTAIVRLDCVRQGRAVTADIARATISTTPGQRNWTQKVENHLHHQHHAEKVVAKSNYTARALLPQALGTEPEEQCLLSSKSQKQLTSPCARIGHNGYKYSTKSKKYLLASCKHDERRSERAIC